ncbi:O-antigen ligase domain-containing protein [Mesorhizobium sp. M2D.F.Ca.ET.185.01.1.1]|uniref:O-antigen ligase family protein n=1 Tax=unclassified Mesorhizobium TaxID=325217 RepID=UPI000FCA6B7F|nr:MULTISPECIES: O-antigen ligase family protein [unclassified Mesorhizobium]TGP80984.1 O-antigen ligase domain-containing protein [bacterium M00.F.Ca.ET.227.01.1.1]TGP90767.1 O-antigen ligase domain-containing protein [bacterium M00.F.Ca.ET.221.01.1.1]TGP97446.1 O-antigen ligase domain-containing protein [bacterium M00.F.Ca.ET.222.01.1.1]TGU07947.1 O-antigen ligase domain-containing protein [bacterium M00.F.Ca.ET.163.01.1.1]TGU33627.1 O-antigen ligase domain-containing protein [bacterium M00.
MSSLADQPGYWSPKIKSPNRFAGFGERFESTNQFSPSGPAALSGKTTFWPVWVFLISLAIPWVFYLGPLRLSVYRLVLLALIVPSVVRLLSGKAGRIRVADIAILMLAVWSVIGLVANHGLTVGLQSAGILFLETVGPYMLARSWVRDADDFQNAVRVLFWIVVALMPFAIVECLGGGNLLLKAFSVVLSVNDYPTVERLGHTRVISVFDHPILFGLNVGSILALTYLVLGYKQSAVHRNFKVALIVVTAATSLSSGPIAGMAAQVFLLLWNVLLRANRHRWKILIGGVFVLVVGAQIFSNRSAISIVTQMIVLDPQTYWYRRLIWEYGSTSVLNHPIFGIGMNDWDRPGWMPNATIDNFWLVEAMRFGIAAPILLLLAGLSTGIAMTLRKNFDERVDHFQTAYLITLGFLFFIGWTVHFWNSTYVLALFLLGSGVWILDAKSAQNEPADTDASPAASPLRTEMGSRRREIFAAFPPDARDEQPLRQATRLSRGSKA